MLISFVVILSVSYATKWIFEKGILDRKWDLFKCVINISDGTNIVLQVRDRIREVPLYTADK